MSDTSATGPGGAAQAGAAPLRFRGQYVRDMSFEVPHAPEIFTELRQSAPDIPITIEPSVRHLSANLYEVTVTASVEAKSGSRVAFILEVAYSGVVELDEKQIPQEHIHPVLMIEVPRYLFPFVRQLVSDATVGGGFPPLMLQMVDFADLYRRQFGDTPQRVAPATAEASATKH